MQPGKRKLSVASQRAVRVRQPAYFIPELAHVVAAADERVPFVNLAQEVRTVLTVGFVWGCYLCGLVQIWCGFVELLFRLILVLLMVFAGLFSTWNINWKN